MAPPQHVTILGAGLSGLTAAYRLSGLCPGTRVTLVDSADRTGGWIRSTRYAVRNGEEEGEVWLESGPRSIRPKGSPGAAGMLRLIVDLGLQDDIIPIDKTHPSARNRFILRSNRLCKLGLNPFTSAISTSTMIRAATEVWRAKRAGNGGGGDGGDGDESVYAFLSRRFGAGVTELASAGMHGIYAASLEDLSAQAVLGRVWGYEAEYGSVLRGLYKDGKSDRSRREKEEERERWERVGELGRVRQSWAMYGLKGGLGSLTRRLEQAVRSRPNVEVRLGESVQGVDLSPGGGVEISTTSGSFSTSHLVSSIPTPALSPLIPSLALPLNPRTTVGVVSLVFPLLPSTIHPNGFGYLIPRPSPSSPSSPSSPTNPASPSPSPNPSGVLGVVFDSTALPGLDTLTNITKLTVMLGGPYYSSYTPTLPVPLTPDHLVPQALEHLRTVFPRLAGVDPIITQTGLHRECIPTYTPGHVARAKDLHGRMAGGPWAGRLSLVGNEWKGIGLNNSIWTAETVSEALAGGQHVTGLEGM